jgi:transcriptional regulator with XRE-family HTH domain
MDPRKVGNLIKDIRKQNNLTQKDLADKYGVTYQAVSKWENGTNLPDIALIKEICKDYNLDINKFLDGSKSKKKINPIVFIVSSIILVLIIIITVLIIIHNNHEISLKDLTTSCDNFQVSGVIAYDSNKSSIRINKIYYCGEEDKNVYDTITATILENNKEIYAANQGYDSTLKDYLDSLNIKLDNYIQKCKLYKDDTLKLIITATKKGVKTVYEIPLHAEDDC